MSIFDQQRRSILIGAITATVSVAATGRGPRAAEDRREVLRRQLGDSFDTFVLTREDRQLDGPEIRTLVSGNTAYGIMHDGEPYLLYFDPSGTGLVKIAERPVEQGKWWIDEENYITSVWPLAAGGEEIPCLYFSTSQSDIYKNLSIPGRRWSTFVLEPGRAEPLEG
ncbi:MAG: hypothetical protein AAF637_10280 [Pseudomonadota bacterium]